MNMHKYKRLAWRCKEIDKKRHIFECAASEDDIAYSFSMNICSADILCVIEKKIGRGKPYYFDFGNYEYPNHDIVKVYYQRDKNGFYYAFYPELEAKSFKRGFKNIYCEEIPSRIEILAPSDAFMLWWNSKNKVHSIDVFAETRQNCNMTVIVDSVVIKPGNTNLVDPDPSSLPYSC